MKLSPTLLLTGALLSAPWMDPAHAASYASATLSLIEVTLTDHDMYDGIPASMELLGWAAGGPAQTNVTFDLRDGTQEVSTHTAIGFWRPVSTQAADGDATLAISTVGGHALDGLMLSSTAGASAGKLFDVDTWAYTGYRYRLSPNTSASFTFDFGVDAHNAPSQSLDAWAQAEVIMAFENANYPDHHIGLSYHDHVREPLGQPGRKRHTATMTTGPEFRSFQVDMGTVAHISLITSPVPEAPSWAMLLAGLMLFGAGSLRRTRRLTHRECS